MDKKKVEIHIGNSVCTITGKDKAYGERIEKLVNDTMKQVRSLPSARNLPTDRIMLLTMINLADMLIEEQERTGNVTNEVSNLKRQHKKLEQRVDQLQSDLMNLEQENMELEEQLHEQK